MKQSNVQLEVIPIKNHSNYSYNTQRFVKATHMDSGISITKYNKSQVKARDEAMEELEYLVEIWESK